MKATVRKEVHLEVDTLKKLQELADKKQDKLKPFMEKVLIKEANKIK